MFAVIFRARINTLNEEYRLTAVRMRDLAINEYGCSEFVACMEGDEEIAISYWQNIEQIHRWRANAEHRLAQEKGRLNWYQAYKVQVVEIQREYSFSQSSA